MNLEGTGSLRVTPLRSTAGAAAGLARRPPRCWTALHRPALSASPAVSQARYVQAKLSVHDRSLKVATVIESLEMEMELLCLTGVEDQLQADVRPTLETLRNAGIKVGGLWRPGCKVPPGKMGSGVTQLSLEQSVR